MQFELFVHSLGLLGLIPVVLMVILGLWGVFTSSGRQRTLLLLGFLIFLSVFLAQLVVQLTRLGFLPYSAWSLWGQYVDFGMIGFYMFLIVLYAIILAFPTFFNERKWIIIVPLIGLIVYEALMYSANAISFALYGAAWLWTGLVLAILFMIVIPLYATFQYTRQDRIRGSPQVIWIWVFMLGALIWAIATSLLFGGWLFQLPGYDSFFSSLAMTMVSSLTIGWYLILVGFIFQRRVKKS
jgi:hypothetical protein